MGFLAAWSVLLLKLNVQFPADPSSMEQIFLRWIHFVSGISWIGLLYFFNLVGFPVMGGLDAGTRGKVFPALVGKAAWWFRWSAAVAWLMGFRYFMILAQADAMAAGDKSLMWKWIGIWFACWVICFGALQGLLQAGTGAIKSGWILAVPIAVVVIIASWLDLRFLASPGAGNRTLSISLGGGLGTIMFFSTWGIVWRCQKRLVAWTRANAEHGTPMPAEAPKLMRLMFLTARMNFWLSFPMLFFMGASSHFPFLSGQ
ncbi:MAG TPA: urate hydroxylase PuuD [Candidatus Acidoferrales bacterium]|nr:urate hydroxylase PuuD [Candidatus Acidoferrales bacterium]